MRAASVLILLLFLARPLPAQETLEESWTLMKLLDVRVGYTHSIRLKHETPGGAEIETRARSRMAVKRMKTEIEIDTDVRHIETADGRPLRFTSRMVMSAAPTITEGVIAGGKLRLKTTSGGVTKETESAWEPDWLLSEGARLLMVKKGFEAGTKYTYKVYTAEYAKAAETEVEIVGPESKSIRGEERRLVRILVKTSLQAGVVVTGWIDEQGSMLAMETSLMGIKVVMEPTTRDEALKNSAAELPEIFFQTMPRSNVALPRPREITSITVRMERPDNGFADWTPPAGSQGVIARDAKSVTLKIEAQKPDPGHAKPGPEHALFLRSSPGVQSDDPDIVRTAKEIAGDEKDPYLVARRLAGWVYKHIDKKSMSIGAASAKEVFTDRAGDCTEHASLLAAMLRAAGIPAKVCCGYLYFRGSWGGHAWASAWVGRWVDFDATLGDGPADAARIKFSETDAEDAGSMIEGVRGAGFMHGGMKVDVQSYTIGGAAVPVGPVAPPAGARFDAPQVGVSFEKPDGWTFGDAKDLPPFTLAVIVSPDNAGRAIVSYIDLPYDLAPLELKKAARKLGAPSSGEGGTLEGRATYQTDSRFYVRLGPAEVVEVVLEGEGAAAPALERFKKTLKITR